MKTIDEKLKSAQENIRTLKKENKALKHLVDSKQKYIQKAVNENKIKDTQIEVEGKWIGYLSHKMAEGGTEHAEYDLREFIDNYDTMFTFDEKTHSYVIKTVKKERNKHVCSERGFCDEV